MARFSLTCLSLLLLLFLVISAESTETGAKPRRRMKRNWLPPPAKLVENTDYTQKTVAKIRSDKDRQYKVEYYLRGKGADEPPYNLFKVDHVTGLVSITSTLDWETHPSFHLRGIARYLNGTEAEDEVPLIFTVVDQNDNAPTLETHYGNVTESSKKGTYVMQITAKDKDDPDTPNAEIAYSIISQEPPLNGHMFRIGKKTGKLYVKEPNLDREKYDFYKLVIQVTDMGGEPGGLTGTGTVEIKVLDINDNIPTLEKSEYDGTVEENVANVVVMKIKALDNDEKFTDNWLAVFKIDKGNENQLFSIETDNKTNEGILKLVKAVDFEEVQNLELGLVIRNVAPFVKGGPVSMDVGVQIGEGDGKGAGLGAGAGAGAGAGVGADLGVDLDVDLGAGLDLGLDLNVDLDADLDADLDGDLGLDAELGPGVGLKPNLGIKPAGGLKPNLGVKPGAGPGAGPGPGPGVGIGLKPNMPNMPGKLRPGPKKNPDEPKSYPIKIAVKNVPEGPAFIPTIKEVPVSEDKNDLPENGVITVFAAVDPDTKKPAEDVSYAKGLDPDNWFTIDEKTAEIKLNKVPDRESPFLVNGVYTAKILAINKDMPPKTATGTIAIKVADSNDHCPTLTSTHSSLCSDKKTVFVTAFDEDADPNAAPFFFNIVPEGTRGSWEVEVVNETTVALHSKESLWPGVYELQLEVKDAQNLSCPTTEVFTVDVCTCEGVEDCSLKMDRMKSKKTEVSAGVIGLPLMALCLLLLVPCFLLLCQCGGAGKVFSDQFSQLPFETTEHLIAYHTEGKGEDKELPLHSVPVGSPKNPDAMGFLNFNSMSSTNTNVAFMQAVKGSANMFGEGTGFLETENSQGFLREDMLHDSSTFGMQAFMQDTATLDEDMALPEDFLANYYSQKSMCDFPVKDTLLEFEEEGRGSPANSVGCCSLLDSDTDLEFLNDLGEKFKILAEICSPSSITVRSSVTQRSTGVLRTTSEVIEPVLKPEVKSVVVRKQSGINTEKSVSSAKTFTSSSSKVRGASSSMRLPHRSRISNTGRSSDVSISSDLGYSSDLSCSSEIGRSSGLRRSATLHYPAQRVVLQQPLYYTTNTMLQPMQYMMAPNPQNTVMLENWSGGSNLSGLVLINGSQGPSGPLISGGLDSLSGVVTSSTESFVNLQSPVSPTVLLSGPPGPGHVSGSAESWGLMAPNSNGPSGPLISGGPDSLSGVVASSTESFVNLQSPVSPTVLLSGPPGPGHVSGSAESWGLMAPNSGGSFMLVSNNSLEAQEIPGPSQGILSREANLE
ncbi:desmoglein-2 [Oryzias melastigma]|uniref:Si:ch73-74h11.1 n=1 Tax=Oryzias melastigma TaxID=30732 RepID=A0A3B3DQ98_ORYME|nr:desmoglein-2 [Oryzias melastigma]